MWMQAPVPNNAGQFLIELLDMFNGIGFTGAVSMGFTFAPYLLAFALGVLLFVIICISVLSVAFLPWIIMRHKQRKRNAVA